MKWAYGLFEVIDIPPAERAVLLALCWDHTDKGGCYPSQERIALMTGYRRRHVNNLLKRLEGVGLIRRKKARTKGKYEKTSYALFGAAKRDSRVHPSAQGGSSSRVHSPAHGYRVHPSAQNRGNTNRGDVIEFPSQNWGTS